MMHYNQKLSILNLNGLIKYVQYNFAGFLGSLMRNKNFIYF